MNKSILSVLILSLLFVGCRKAHENHQQNDPDIQISAPTTTIHVTQSVINTDEAILVGDITISGINVVSSDGSKYCRVEVIKYFSTNKDHSFDDLRWIGRSRELKIISETNSISTTFNTTFKLPGYEKGIDPNRDRYFNALLTVTDKSKEQVLFKTWETAEINWK